MKFQGGARPTLTPASSATALIPSLGLESRWNGSTTRNLTTRAKLGLPL
jgi:hypothetical protein